MRKQTKLSVWLVLLITLVLSGCYSVINIPGEEIILQKRDRILMVQKDSVNPERIHIGMVKNSIDGAYIYMDTLYIRVNSGDLSNPGIKEFKIPVSEIHFAEIRRLNREATTAAGVAGGVVLIALSIIVMIGLIWVFTLIFSAL